ncbi:MAG: DUF2460 domain-containing protein [Pleurocapsa sp.]
MPVEFVPSAANPNPVQFVSAAPYPKPYIAPEFIDFAEVRLELGYDYGCVGGPEFKTTVNEVADGRESRNSLFVLPRGRWQLGNRLIADSDSLGLEEVTYLATFHQDRQGSLQGFRFKDFVSRIGPIIERSPLQPGRVRYPSGLFLERQRQ